MATDSLCNFKATHRPPFPLGGGGRPGRPIHQRLQVQLPVNRQLKLSRVGKNWAAGHRSNYNNNNNNNAVVMMAASRTDHLAAERSATVERIESAKFQHALWEDHFLSDTAPFHSSTATTTTTVHQLETWEYEALKEEVRKMVMENDHVTGITEKLRLIDAIQRLGIGYHFETEIEEALEKVYVLGGESFIDDGADLYHAALWFRLLRQQGFRVSPGNVP